MEETPIEKRLFVVRIWWKDFDHKWHYMGKKRILADNVCGAADEAIIRYGLDRWPDYKLNVPA